MNSVIDLNFVIDEEDPATASMNGRKNVQKVPKVRKVRKDRKVQDSQKSQDSSNDDEDEENPAHEWKKMINAKMFFLI